MVLYWLFPGLCYILSRERGRKQEKGKGGKEVKKIWMPVDKFSMYFNQILKSLDVCKGVGDGGSKEKRIKSEFPKQYWHLSRKHHCDKHMGTCHQNHGMIEMSSDIQS